MYGNHYGTDKPRPGEMRRLMFRSVGAGILFIGGCGVAINTDSAIGYVLAIVGLLLFTLGLERYHG